MPILSKVILKLNSPLEVYFHTITYIKLESAFTTFVFENEESLPIQLNFVDVFLEDLEMLLKHQTPYLSYFHVRCSRGTVEDCAKICERLEMILKSRTLRVKGVHFIGTSVAQAISLVTYFDQSAPFTVRLIHVVDPENFDSSWNGLSEVKIEDDGQSITFEVADPTFQSINLKKGKNPSEIVARYVLENRLSMGLILRHLQCFDIESLRKVNRGIRKCVDLIKPNPHIETYSICFYQRAIIDNCRLRIYNKLENGEFKAFEYFKNGNQVYLYGENSFHGEERIISFSGTDDKSICLNDIEKTLSKQIECIKELIIFYKCTRHLSENFDILLDEWGTADLSRKIGDTFKRRETPLKAKKFSMGSSSQMEIIEILSAIDPHSLKTIELLYPSEQHDAIKNFYYNVIEWPFQIDQLSKIVQWKNAERLISKHLIITTTITEMNILNFVYLNILVKTLSSEDVFYLKTNLLHSSKFQKLKISFQESTIDESLHTLIGEPYRNFSNVKSIWYFRIENTNYYIHIVLDTRKKGVGTPKLITLTRVAKEDTPFFELPMNQLVIN
ncbi:Protein CBG26669 [Caenorhabditis briggsae]|uniref:Protein CBG24367 n=1 Tax=Caenorhabditis briggsae TaxID=6238 RepID=G2J677_CAEBR|nr:Protein CBG24367 [Caenorhabditis briggsae]XP_045100653.1 Protein CBG26669 [Caenorhabditis briggsae]CAP20990.2 Protein CBG24367 [Caenorhabditis briggsae]CAS01096.1 Protein CBG26669 [Caenorhabditis briggsae]